jgi:hypothetical protein
MKYYAVATLKRGAIDPPERLSPWIEYAIFDAEFADGLKATGRARTCAQVDAGRKRTVIRPARETENGMKVLEHFESRLVLDYKRNLSSVKRSSSRAWRHSSSLGRHRSGRKLAGETFRALGLSGG